jgi:hypothetical protein
MHLQVLSVLFCSAGHRAVFPFWLEVGGRERMSSCTSQAVPRSFGYVDELEGVLTSEFPLDRARANCNRDLSGSSDSASYVFPRFGMMSICLRNSAMPHSLAESTAHLQRLVAEIMKESDPLRFDNLADEIWKELAERERDGRYSRLPMVKKACGLRLAVA